MPGTETPATETGPMLDYSAEQRHLLNIAVARKLSAALNDAPDPAGANALLLEEIAGSRLIARSLTRLRRPWLENPTVSDFQEDPFVADVIDGCISRGVSRRLARALGSEPSLELLAELSLCRLALSPAAAQWAGPLSDLAERARDGRRLRRELRRLEPALTEDGRGWRQAAEASREALLVAYEPLIQRIARESDCGDMPQEDREQEGRWGLLQALNRYDHRRGNRFGTLARFYIRTAVKRGGLRQGYGIYLNERVTQERARQAEPAEGELNRQTLSLDALLYDETAEQERNAGLLAAADHTMADCLDSGLSQEMDGLLNRLPELEAQVIRLRYGLAAEGERSPAETALLIGIDEDRLPEIETRALGLLREQAGARSLRDWLD